MPDPALFRMYCVIAMAMDETSGNGSADSWLRPFHNLLYVPPTLGLGEARLLELRFAATGACPAEGPPANRSKAEDEALGCSCFSGRRREACFLVLAPPTKAAKLAVLAEEVMVL